MHRYNMHHLRRRKLGEKDVQSVIDFAQSSKDEYLTQVAMQLAEGLRDDNLENRKEMQELINRYFLLRAAVADAEEALVNRTEEHIAESQRRDEAVISKATRRVKKAETKRNVWAEKNRRDTELNRSVMEKMKAGKKCVLTREEARYYERSRGKRGNYTIAG